MKQLLPLFLALLCGFRSLPAQSNLPDGYLSTDYEFVDIEGNWHSLYQYLDQGKAIIIDFSAFTCSVCWNYHTSGAMQSIYETHGPDGTDEVMVFMFQAGPNYYPPKQSILDGLKGTSQVSSGDWVSTSPYPIIISSLGSDYRIPGTPSVVTICPNRVTRFSRTISATEHYRFIQENCEAPAADFDVALIEVNGEVQSCSGGEYIPQVKIQNRGSSAEAFTEATIRSYLNDNLVNTDRWTGSLNTFGFTGVTLSPVPSPSVGEAFDLRVELDWAADQVSDNNSISTEIALPEPIEGPFRVEVINTNDSTHYWYEILDAQGEVVRRRTSLDDFLHTDSQIYLDEFELPTGCYQLRLFCESERFGSFFRFFDRQRNLLTENPRYRRTWTYEEGVRYTAFEVLNNTPTATQQPSTAIALGVAPNPAREQLTLDYTWERSQDIHVHLVDIQGQRWPLGTESVAVGRQSHHFALPSLAPGLYFLEIRGESGQYWHKLLIQ
ncbi:MAG: T9SS type A sorting domain-containing protein [Bacteroidota bacterium]